MKWTRGERHQDPTEYELVTMRVDTITVMASNTLVTPIPGRLEAIESKYELDAPHMSVDDDGQMSVVDGRHRIRLAQERGYESITVAVRR